MDLPSIADRLRRRFGDDVEPWVWRLPTLLAELTDRWSLRLGTAFTDGSTSVVLPCVTVEGWSAVLKLSPDHTFLAEQARVLRAFAPSGRVPEVLAADVTVGALLLEAVLPGTPLTRLPAPPVSEFGALLHDLHGSVAHPEHVVERGLLDWTEEFLPRFERRLAEPAVAEFVRADDLLRSRALRDRIVGNASRIVLLHGDLHFRNVLDGGPERGLMAIDPKACVGDPAFDAVDFVLGGAGAEGIARRHDAMATVSDVDADQLHLWCKVMAPVNAIVLLVRHPDRRGEVDELLSYART